MAHPRSTIHPSRGPHNSLLYVRRDVWLGRILWNSLWIILSRWVPWFNLKRGMLRLTGAKIGKHTAIGFEATLDILFPQDITIGRNVIVGYNSTILCHGYLNKVYHRGNVTIEDDVSIGAGCTILPGVTIGKGAIIGAMSLVNRDVPPGEFWAGTPARRRERSRQD